MEEAYSTLRLKLESVGKAWNINDSDAEDLLQESYLKLLDQPMSNKKEAHSKLWVSIKNLAVDNFRKCRKGVDEQVKDSLESPLPADFRCDYDSIITEMRISLSPLQFEIMQLLVVEDYDYPEIADKLNMSEGAIRTNVCRARKILKEKLRK